MLPVNIQVSQVPSTISKAALRALKHELYQSKSWMFYDLFQYPESILKIATAFHNRKPVGVAVYWDYDKHPLYKFSCDYNTQVGCYVKEDFRRHKIGHQLVNRIKAGKQAAVGRGLPGSVDFWKTTRPGAQFQS